MTDAGPAGDDGSVPAAGDDGLLPAAGDDGSLRAAGVDGGAPAARADERVRVARVADAAPSVAACSAAVAGRASGAVVTFEGVVRDHDEGRGVTDLHYEAHPAAGDVLTEVARDVAARHPDVILAVEHRVGDLVVGDVALACAVASAHRAAAFTACADLVDEVKARVPIWKHQRFTDGTDEWVAALG